MYVFYLSISSIHIDNKKIKKTYDNLSAWIEWPAQGHATYV